jgi:hypothetical protein
LYILLEGEAEIVNTSLKTVGTTLLSENSHNFGKIDRFSAFGFGRYLDCQGITFYGDIVATGPPDKSVLCVYIPGSLFHKIPFEDWYRLRDEFHKSKLTTELLKESKKRYWLKYIRPFKQ